LGGGYPEIYAKDLSGNSSMLESIKNALTGGTPCIAECGGFMYLLDRVTDTRGDSFAMTGTIKGEAFMTEKLNRFGYLQLISQGENVLCGKGDTIRAHEFHYSDSTANGSGFRAVKPSSGKNGIALYRRKHLRRVSPYSSVGKREFCLFVYGQVPKFKMKRRSC
jgi:cobyrinic acid a,c-diamide synthase